MFQKNKDIFPLEDAEKHQNKNISKKNQLNLWSVVIVI